MRPADIARDHYTDRQAFVAGAAEVAGQMWAGVDPTHIVESWTAQIGELATVVVGAQTGAARAADGYVDEVLDAQDLDVSAAYEVVPSAFSGSSVDGGDLVKQLYQPVIQTLLSIGGGASSTHALSVGGHTLDAMTRTLVADSGRAADQASLTAHPGADGYTRLLTPPSCSRCAVLAGRWYRYDAAFQRHPRCDCTQVPGRRDVAHLTDPFKYYRSLSDTQRKAAGWTAADQLAIADGADLFQVTNAHRGLSTAGGRSITSEGTTKRGFAGSRLKGKQRLTPKQIYTDAGGDRDAALKGLFDNGYLLKAPVPAARERLVLAAAEAGPAGAAASGTVRRAVKIRTGLQRAKTAEAVSKKLRSEVERIAGRRALPVNLHGAVETARDHAEGLLRGLEGFPDANLGTVDTGRIANSKAYAVTRADGGDIRFSESWSTVEERDHYLKSTLDSAAAHFHPDGFDSPIGAAIHEFGHVVDLSTLNGAAHQEISRIVATAAHRAGLTPAELIARDVSRYATHSTEELVAEAFGDVMVRGDQASQLSRDIFDALRAEYERTGRRFVATPPAAGELPKPARAVKATTPGKMTVAQLRAAAKERGIVIPPRALKADIERLLEQPAGELSGPEKRAAARARNREIERRDKAESVLAQLDEDLAKDAGPDVLAQHLGGDQLDPKDMDALRKVLGDRTKLKAAITRIGKKYGISPTSRAGQVVKFDETLHESIAGIHIEPGTKVAVVRRGAVLSLPDGTVLTPTRALVRTAATKTRAAAAPRAATQYEARQAALRELIKQTATDTRQLGGGAVADVRLMTFPDGTKVVEKVYGRRMLETPAELRREIDAEHLGAQVLEAVGLKAPAVVQSGAPGRLLMEYLDGVVGGGWRPGAEVAFEDTAEARMMGLADYLMANTDRNAENWIVLDDGHLAGIDHGYAFTRASKFDVPNQGRFADYLMAPNWSRLAKTVDVAPEDVALIRARLEALRSKFVQAKRLPWFNQMMARLAEVEKRATGTVRRLAT